MDRKTIYLHVRKHTVRDEACCALLRKLDALDREYSRVLESLSPEQCEIHLKYHHARDNMMTEMMAVAYEMGQENEQA